MSEAVQNFSVVLHQVAEQEGIDLGARLAEVKAKRLEAKTLLIERLHDPVAPLLISDPHGHPAQFASCVLVKLCGHEFAFTAAHVIRDSGGTRLFSCPEAHGGDLLPLPYCDAHLLPSKRENDPDVAVIALPRKRAHCFHRRAFLTESDIDLDDEADDQSNKSSYFVLGYPGSRSQFQLTGYQIEQTSFHTSTTPVSSAEYLNEGLSQETHIALDYDHEEIRVAGKPFNPPKLQGVSGGGIFRVFSSTGSCKLVGIATQNRRASRLIIGTRISHFLSIARELSS